ncbi:MAG: hypothetical protein RBT62_12915 [Spirochaetia bacterium]|nr:hypothetical protein [Spirochaetia bacterium]
MTMFNPEEILFAPTSRCNLQCSHCGVSRGGSELGVDESIAFLDSCLEGGIERVGYSGGEPFLRLDYICAVSKAATDRGMFFDRLMTNGDWWNDLLELRTGLEAVFEAGFDGIIGLSYDAFHGQSPERISTFIAAVFDVWGRRDALELLSVRSSSDESFYRDLGVVASALGGHLESSGGEPVRIIDASTRPRSESDPDDGKILNIPVLRFPLSKPAAEASWNASRWFVDDYCAGPGNVFYVHPDGSVAVCCGFANENPALIIGTVRDSYERLMANAKDNAHVRTCYETGLGELRKRLESEGVKFPGKTGDMCMFCDFLLQRPQVQA